MYYQIERLAAEQLGLRWRDRGPAASEGVEEFRGQRWRAQRERWGNRGGRNRDWFEAFYTLKGKGFGKDEAWRRAPEMKGKGRG